MNFLDLLKRIEKLVDQNGPYNNSLQRSAEKLAPADLRDKLTVSGAHGQLIGGGCFAIALDRLRSRSAYQGQWSRLRFSVLA